MARSILGLVGLGATLVFALPAAVLGLEFLLVQGRTVAGVALVVVAVLMVAVEEYVTTPDDVPSIVAEQTVGRLADSDDEDG
ncbi:hypothetical protein BRC64_02360 [Halobacteriales archaeon QH_10_67_22]|nr:MAG: hypothetical protein BRC64_02360 [Halobacteriales archaeon QH_10_67_22]